MNFVTVASMVGQHRAVHNVISLQKSSLEITIFKVSMIASSNRKFWLSIPPHSCIVE